MTRRRRRIVAVAYLTLAIVVYGGLGAAIAHVGDRHGSASNTAHARQLDSYTAERTVPVRERGTQEVAGMATVHQRGHRLVGTIVMSGLEPGRRYANDLHAAPTGEGRTDCSFKGEGAMRERHRFPDLVANAKGVAYATFRAGADERVVRRGVSWEVHAATGTTRHPGRAAVGVAARNGRERADEASPVIACGLIR